MFGSKIKNWVENHLGRQRKKGNKNKNAMPCDHLTAAEQYKQKHSATGYTLYNGNSNSSPYKTNSNSISSSANHTGCSSSVISSPNRRREVSPIQNHTQSRYGWQSPDWEHIISPKSENFLYAPQHHSQQYLRNHHTAPNTRENSCEDNKIACKQQQQQQQQNQNQHQLNCSTSSFSSLSWSTGSKDPSMQSNNMQNSNSAGVAAVTSTNTSINNKSHTLDETKLSDDDPNVVHYEEIDEIGTLIRHPEKLLTCTLTDIERPKSEQYPKPSQKSIIFSDNKQTQDDASTRYGRLLPSKIQNPVIVSFRTGSEECIPRNATQFSGQNAKTDILSSSYTQNRNGMRNILRTGIYPSAQGNAAVPLVSLSSPESAYSTGYSTDGTSPGAGYTPPEYYINIRTGTHYFPKSVNSLAIEAQRYKFGLNKIEEMSPIDPLPKTPFALRNNEESCSTATKETTFSEPYEKSMAFQAWQETEESKSPLPIRNTIVIPTLKGFESPSPRQRCRIRTNPWYSTTETSSSSSTVNPLQIQNQMQQTAQLQHHAGGSLMNTSLTSSMTFSSTSSHSTSALSTIHLEQDFQRSMSPGFKSCRNSSFSKTAMSVKANNNNMSCVSSESSSSLTEVENIQRCYTPNTIRHKRLSLPHYNQLSETIARNNKINQEPVVAAPTSDDDATLNEMMGKFDESYIYEKETDILSSDSDPTDCPTDLDTGQDAGDECDTDDLLDIDFIDTSSVQEICEHKDPQINSGKCYYVQGSPLMVQKRATTKTLRRSSRSIKILNEQLTLTAAATSAQRRRKRFHKTRKKSSDSREYSRSPLRKPRETRSVGGTPVCLRKHIEISEKQKFSHTTPHRLSHRSSSLVFTGVRENRCMTVAESEKVLLKADFEADIKYRQLIMEAESILLSMRNSVQSVSRETPVASPRRLNPLANKRVEMIKNCEIEPKRDNQKQQHSPKKYRSNDLSEQELTAAVNKRIEILKLETLSPPGSPKMGQCSPRKTHLTNFINQNISTEIGIRKTTNSTNSPLVQRRNTSPVPSPIPTPQRCSKLQQSNSHPPTRLHNLQLSDSDLDSNKPNKTKYDDVLIKNINFTQQNQNKGPQIKLNYCPQSEPLKRKVYKNYSSSVERNHEYFKALQAGVPLQDRQDQLKQQHLKSYNSGSDEFSMHNRKLELKSNSQDLNYLSSSHQVQKTDFNTNFASEKAALILSTIEDLKRNLEHQSIELNGLHDS